jgi:putative ABC transport system ATP-binding protein
MPLLYDLKRICRTRSSGSVSFELRIPEFRSSFGEFVAVIGPSGCGKSSFLDLLALVLRPDEDSPGTFRFGCPPKQAKVHDIIHFWRNSKEKDIAAIRRYHIGYVLQTGGLLPFMSVRRNVELACRLKGIDHVGTRVQKIAITLGIDDQLAKKPQYISGGERQRAAIARAMIHQPLVVLADEPTAAVDHDRAQTILQEFSHLARENGTAIIVATHNYQLVKEMADQVVTFRIAHFLEAGKKKTVSTLIRLGDSVNGKNKSDTGFRNRHAALHK